MKIFTFPFPPSDNTAYPSNWKTGRRYLSPKGKTYKEYVKLIVRSEEPTYELFSITMHLYPPDKRIRDVGNYDKLTLDALVDFIYHDDVQVKELHLYMMPKDKTEPRVVVEIDEIKINDDKACNV